MVGYNPQSDLKLNNYDIIFAGAVSSIVARAVSQPLDVLKIRFQLQHEPISSGCKTSKYTGLLQAVRLIVVEEGLTALWKGHVPAQILSIGYGVVQYAAFEYLTTAVWRCLPEKYTLEHKALVHILCGSIAASISTATIQPLDVIRTRFVAQGEPKMYKSMLSAGRHIIRTEGVRGFYKGLNPAILGIAPQMGLQFGLYAMLQNSWNTVFHLPKGHHPGTVESLICGSGSGFISKLMVYPMDVAKKRLQVQGFEEARRPFGQTQTYQGLLHLLKSTIKDEGVWGLYKGLVPSLIKAAVVSGTMFCVYDQICYAISFRHS